VISNAQLNATMVGTPLYMSPQQLKCEKYSSKCDIWAIGLIFFEMIYGKLPWVGRSEYELVKN
jgi:serine/threonine protein kinase